MEAGRDPLVGRLCVSQAFHFALYAALIDRTWTADHSLAALAIGEARRQGIERILATKRLLEDWREWIYLSLMDKL